MRIPACKLIESLECVSGESLPLRKPNFEPANPALPILEAFALAMRGEIEGIASPSGRLRFLRLLNEDEIVRPEEIESGNSIDAEFGGGCLMPSNLRLGVYRQAVTSTRMAGYQTDYGLPAVETVVIGHIYQHYMCRI